MRRKDDLTKEEFEDLAGYSVSYMDFYDKIGPTYAVIGGSKEEFVKGLDRSKLEKTKEQLQNQVINQMRVIARHLYVNGHEPYFYVKDLKMLNKLASYYSEISDYYMAVLHNIVGLRYLIDSMLCFDEKGNVVKKVDLL